MRFTSPQATISTVLLFAAFNVHAMTASEIYQQAAKSTVVVQNLDTKGEVHAIGAPKGLELTLSDGVVSSLREVEGGHYIQTTAAI